MKRTCRNCQQPNRDRAGRGLCRVCWNDPAIKAQFAPVAKFGGTGAALLVPKKAKKAAKKRVRLTTKAIAYRISQEAGAWLVVRTSDGLWPRTVSTHGTEQAAESSLRELLAVGGVDGS